MNLLRRYTLHRLRSRHNPLTRVALLFILLVIVTSAQNVVSELLELRIVSEADKKMIAEFILFTEGKANLIEQYGEYAVEYSVQKKTYEVK